VCVCVCYLMTVPSSLVVMVPSPSLSNREKASLNSAICSSVKDLAASSLDIVKGGRKREREKKKGRERKRKREKEGERLTTGDEDLGSAQMECGSRRFAGCKRSERQEELCLFIRRVSVSEGRGAGLTATTGQRRTSPSLLRNPKNALKIETEGCQSIQNYRVQTTTKRVWHHEGLTVSRSLTQSLTQRRQMQLTKNTTFGRIKNPSHRTTEITHSFCLTRFRDSKHGHRFFGFLISFLFFAAVFLFIFVLLHS